METPEDKRRRVFSKGMLIGLNAIISWGGHLIPNSTLGEILLWKNAQKNDVKNSTSEIINKSIPTCKPTVTCFLWFPCSMVSEKTFFHQLNDTIINTKNVKIKVVVDLVFIHNTIEVVKQKAEIEPIKGQGLFSTIWKGWNFFSILIFCCIKCN